MKQPDFKLVRIPRKAGDALEKFTAKENYGAMRVNASHFIGEAIMEKIAKINLLKIKASK